VKAGKAEREHPAFRYGRDKDFLDWLTYQPSCLDGTFNQWQDGVGRNLPCHVRRAGSAGTAFKPVFSAVPMTDAQHKVQSGKGGEVEAVFRYTGRRLSLDEAKAWFDEQAEFHLRRWINEMAEAGMAL
jgi:hypothetical protein